MISWPSSTSGAGTNTRTLPCVKVKKKMKNFFNHPKGISVGQEHSTENSEPEIMKDLQIDYWISSKKGEKEKKKEIKFFYYMAVMQSFMHFHNFPTNYNSNNNNNINTISTSNLNANLNVNNNNNNVGNKEIFNGNSSQKENSKDKENIENENSNEKSLILQVTTQNRTAKDKMKGKK